jgi:hypothetical protein
MKKSLLACVVVFLSGCGTHVTSFDPAVHTFVNMSSGSKSAKVLSGQQAVTLVSLIRGAPSSDSMSAGTRTDSLPQPQLAPSLCINVYRDKDRTAMLGQILGFEKKWIVVNSRYVIQESNTVTAVYKVLE